MFKKILSTALAGGLLVTLGAGVASAAPTVTEDVGSLTIHKFEQPVLPGSSNGGLVLPDEDIKDLVGLNDVEFTVTKINNIDLSTNAGWTAFSELYADFDPADAVNSLTPPGLSTTDVYKEVTETVGGVNGVAKFDNLPIGAYLVQETDAPDNVTKSLPFLVTIPVTDPTTNGWVYDVHAYPKNVVTDLEKTVSDSDAFAVGDDVVFTIIGSIPAGYVTDYYVIKDQLDSKLDVAATGAVTVKAGETTLTSPADFGYTVDTNKKIDDPDNPGTEIDNPEYNLVTITLTEQGREAIYAELVKDENAKVVVTLTTQINESGVIDNQAVLFPNSSSVDTDGVPSNKVTTKWGGIEILKFNADDDTKAFLAGAKFEVYGSKNPLGANGQLPTDAKKITGLPGMDTNGILTTTNSGKLVVDGLRYSDFANNESQTADEDGYNYYFVVEVEAPEGFNLLAKPVQFTVTSAAADSVTVEIANSPVIDYPGSGGAGTAWIIVAGVVTLMVAGGLILNNNKKKIEVK